MKLKKKLFPVWIVFCLVYIQCSPASDSLREDKQTTEVSGLVMISPEKGAKNIPVNSELVWKEVEEATEYGVQLSDQYDFSDPIVDLLVDSSRIELNGLPYDNTIYWKVRAIINDEPGLWSQILDFSTESEPEDAVPTKTTLKLPADKSVDLPLEINLIWTVVVSASNYQLQIATDGNFENIIVEEFVEGAKYSLSELNLGETYYWRVLPHVNETETTWSETWMFSTQTAPSTAITLFTPKNGATGQPTTVTFKWGTLSGVNNYNIQVATDDLFESTIVDEVETDTLFKASGLSYETNFYWRIRKITEENNFKQSSEKELIANTGVTIGSGNPSGRQFSNSSLTEKQSNEEWSEVWHFKTESPSTEPRVQLSSPSDNTTGLPATVTLSWKKLSGIDEYQVQMATDDSFSNPTVNKTISAAGYKAGNLNNGKTYYWRVRAKGGTWSEIWSFTTEEIAVPPVTLTDPMNNATDQPTELTLEWEKLSGIDKYQVQMATDDSFSKPTVDKTISAAGYKAGNLKSDKTYYWRVRAKGGSWSEIWSFTTEEIAVPPVTLTDPVNNATDQPTELTLEWEKLSGIDEYQVQMATDDSFSKPTVDKTVSAAGYKAGNLNNGKTYYWRVRVKDGTWSEIWSFTTEEIAVPPVTLTDPVDNATDQPTELTLEWGKLSGIDEYQVQVAKNNSFSNLIYDEIINQTYFHLNDLDKGVTYHWKVQAFGSGMWSDTWKFTTEELPPTPPPSTSSFVSSSNSNFTLDGKAFRFAGTNAYYLPNYEKIDSRLVNNTLDAFQEAGITVVRMWAFYDGYDCGYSQHDANENVIQTAPGKYSESALQDLDRVIAKGKERGIRFILPFINYWDELGGICQYNTWDGASNPSTNMAHFINSSNAQKWFKDYIKMLLNRVNTITGVSYKNEPAILGWEIMNEARLSGEDPTVLRDWYRNIAKYIKSIDSKHLLTTGEEGFDEGTPSEYSVSQYSNTYVLRANEGTSYILNTAIPEIDFGSAHWYPSDWGFGSSVTQNMINAQHAWLNDHAKIAANFGKPVFIGEYGYSGWGNQAMLNVYKDLWEYAEDIKLDGSLLWQLTTDYVKCYEFGGNICWPDGRQDTDLYNNFRKHIQNMNNSN